MNEFEHEKGEKIAGQEAGYAIDYKRLIRGEQDLDEILKAQYLVFHEQMLNHYVKYDREVDQVALSRMQDSGLERKKGEIKERERQEELEETMTRQVATVNESIAGLIATLNALVAQANLVKGELESLVEIPK